MNKFNQFNVCALALGAAGWTPAAGADAVTDWNRVAGDAAIAACLSPQFDPLRESRLYAMTHIAIHDALSAIQRRSQPYAYDALAAAGSSAEAAVAAAARDVLVAEIARHPFAFAPECAGGGLALVEAEYAAALAVIPDGAARTAGIAVGQAAAAAIIDMRANDGAGTEFADFTYLPGTEPGEWRFTSGLPPFALAPGWGSVTPFALTHSGQFAPHAPYPVSCSADENANKTIGSCRQYARDLNDVKMYGGAGDNIRSDDETEIALFWMESSPLSWNRMGREATAGFGLDLWDNARLYALLNMAMADGYVASLQAKYGFRFWRPETAIREAGSDGNPFTSPDPDWTSLTPTPPAPDHESAHAVEGAAAAEVFRRVLGTNHVNIASCSLSLPDPTTRCGGLNEIRRSFSSFSEAARENGRSRVLVGYHFQNAVDEGLKRGRKIGTEVVTNYLQAVN
ncbi:MAG: vanadium-dependent haloperoxidase [Steroidobacteraceae bacterium]